ncbi:MAG: endonuclease MutS2 [Lachnospiraceae bacterium]
MNEKALHTLEYDKIIDMLVEFASTPIGKDMCRNLKPMDKLDDIRKAQQETDDAFLRIVKKGTISFSGAKDIRPSIMRLKVGGSLSIIELLNIASLLKTAYRAKEFGYRQLPEGEEPDSLDEYFSLLEPLTSLEREIDRCILSEEEISDDASPALRSIRRNIKMTIERVRSQLNSVMNNNRNYLQDAVITMRNGRYCLPVKSENRSQVPGMIHDQSSSGSTVFVEPASVVKANNELRELEIKEQKEIEIILANLSNQAAEHIEYLEDDLKILSLLDFIFAKAMLSRSYQGTRPKFNYNKFIRIKKGRHPLLDKKKVVPIDLQLGGQFHQLIITGPNTGGKTVSLKTVGLFTLMGQAGLQIPAFDGSQLSVFKEVYADIGDEQSIEQSLSTFSAHMVNIVDFINKADKDSLVLFDELGAGTDPTEGAALAISILNFLRNLKIRTMATTHYSELKIYALSTEGVENASCEFNVETLQPTYRLILGIPGKSNAFAISQKLGLPDYIIDDAKSRIDSSSESFEDVIADLEASRLRMEEDQEKITQYKEEIEALKAKLEAKQEKLDAQRDKILQDANEKAQAILQDAKDYADETIRIINKKTQSGDIGRSLEEERTKLRNKLNTVNTTSKSKPAAKKKEVKPDELHIGDGVHVISMNLDGIVSTLPNAKGDLYVQMGILRSLVSINDIAKLNEATTTGPGITKERSSTGSIRVSKSSTISPEINLIGMTVDEALPELDKYLDDAYLAHLPQVRVVHGRGTGALKNAVHNKLRRLKYVDSYRLGAFGEGDTGVTIVTFK